MFNPLNLINNSAMNNVLTKGEIKHLEEAYFLIQRVIESSDIYPLSEVAYGRVFSAFEHIAAIVSEDIEDRKFPSLKQLENEK